MKTAISGQRLLGNQKKPLEISNLKRINVLFGKNGTGKSSFLRNIYQSDSNKFHLVVPERGGGSMKYNSGIYDQENRDNDKRNVRSTNFDTNYRDRAISRTVAISQSVGYKKLKGIDFDEINAEKIESLFSVFLPEFNAKFSDVQPHSVEFYRVTENRDSKVEDSNQLSSGQAEALSLAADIVSQAVLWRHEKKCILVDEPDAHLHLDLQNRFAIFVEEISKNFNLQFIVATHSQALIAALMNVCDDVGVICLDDNSEKISAIPKSSNFIFSNLLSSDLALSLILGRKIVIVEGNDDFLIWNQAARNQNFIDISLIEANGSDILEQKKYTEQILESVCGIKEQLGITITDRDKRGDATHDEGSLLPIKRLNCYSIENLLLTDETLKTIKDAVDLNNELESLKQNCTREEIELIERIKKDKKNTKISKELTKKIHNHIDNHAVSTDWRTRVGKLLGKGRPEGELADFIGEDIVDYIWRI